MGLGSSSSTYQWPGTEPQQMAAHVAGLLERVNKTYDREEMDQLSGLLLSLPAQELSQVRDAYRAFAKGHTLQREIAENKVLISRGLLTLLSGGCGGF